MRIRSAPGRHAVALAIGVVCLLLLGAAALAWLYGLQVLPLPASGVLDSVAAVEDLILAWGAWGMLASVALMILHSFVPFPAEILGIANGMLYGPVMGTILTWVGGMLGAWLAFGCTRLLGRPFLEKVVAAERLEQIDQWAQHHGGVTLLLARLIPVIAFNLLNYGAALTRMSWWTFTWATGLGILPMCVLLATAGASIFEWPLWVWIALVGAIALLWIALKKLRSGAGPDREPTTPR